MKFHAIFSLLVVATFSAFTTGKKNDVTIIGEQQEEGSISGLRKNNNNRVLTEGLNIPAESRIVNGTDAPDDVYRFFVSWGGCGASLVASDVILSAAHCQGQSTNQVRIGQSRKGFYSNGEARMITRRISHPNYRSSSINYDYMIMKLDQPVNTSIYPPIGLNRENNVPADGEELTVIGFGTLNQGGYTPSRLQEVNVNYVSTETCKGSYGGDVKDATMFCAGTGGGKDSCQGDSGGPIFTNMEPIQQVGIVSWGRGCAQELYPGVYSRISGEYDWIKAQICSIASDRPAYCTDDNDNLGIASGSDQASGLGPLPTSASTPIPTSAPTPIPGNFLVRLEIFYDNYPDEVGWTFEQSGQILLSQDQGSITSKGGQQYEVRLNSGDATFTITDSYGDGICCRNSIGSGQGYTIIDETSDLVLAESNGRYGSYHKDEFKIPSLLNSESIPTPAPVQILTPVPAPILTPAPVPIYIPAPVSPIAWWCELLGWVC